MKQKETLEKKEDEFPASRWNRVKESRICLQCVEGRKCSVKGCGVSGGLEKFSQEEWAKPDALRRCKDCVPKRCCQCRKGKVRSKYSAEQWKQVEGAAVCYDCDKKRCGKCGKEKGYKDFDPAVWEMADGSDQYCCRACGRGPRVWGQKHETRYL